MCGHKQANEWSHKELLCTSRREVETSVALVTQSQDPDLLCSSISENGKTSTPVHSDCTLRVHSRKGKVD